MKRISAILTALALLLAASVALAQSEVGYELKRSLVAGGGGTSSGGDYVIRSSIGQSDSGRLNGGYFVLAGGFWSEAGSTEYRVYLPVILRNYASGW